MGDVPDGTLVKAHVGFTESNLTWKQYLFGIIAALFDFKMYKLTLASYMDENSWSYIIHGHVIHIYHVYVAAAVLVSLLVYFLIRSELAFYRGWNFICFLYRWIRKTDTIYKFDEKTTSDKKMDKHVKLRKLIKDTGVARFAKCKSYGNKTCDTGMVFVANPQMIGSFKEFQEIMSILLYSVEAGLIQKYSAIQSQDMRDLAAQYEERLRLPTDKLPASERVGLYYTKQFLQSLSGRVNWAYFAFIGTGYFTDEKEAVEVSQRIQQSYEHFLEMSGVECRLITSQYEYQLIYRQMSNMRQLGLVTV